MDELYFDRTKKAIKELGLDYLAKRLDVSKQTITNWYTRGIPEKYILEFCKIISKKRCFKVYPDFFSEKYSGFYNYYKN